MTYQDLPTRAKLLKSQSTDVNSSSYWKIFTDWTETTFAGNINLYFFGLIALYLIIPDRISISIRNMGYKIFSGLFNWLRGVSKSPEHIDVRPRNRISEGFNFSNEASDLREYIDMSILKLKKKYGTYLTQIESSVVSNREKAIEDINILKNLSEQSHRHLLDTFSETMESYVLETDLIKCLKSQELEHFGIRRGFLDLLTEQIHQVEIQFT